MKIFFAIAFLLILRTSVFSQILVGPVAGANYSWTSFGDKDQKDFYTVKPRWGYHVGAHLSFKVQKRFFLHASFLYSTKGRVLDGKADPELKLTAHYNYIEMPISYTVDFKAKLGGSKEFKYFFGIGPNISYWLNGRGTLFNGELDEANKGMLDYKVAFKTPVEEQQENEMTIEQPNRVQFGLNFVAGLVLEPAPRQRIMVSLRYELGHTYLAKTNGMFLNTYFQDPLQSRNQGFRASIAYLYDLKTENRKKGKSTIDKRKPK